MDIDVENIDKNDQNIWRTIYKVIDAPYFRRVKLLTKSFLHHCEKHTDKLQKFPTETKKNVKILLEVLYVQVVIIFREIMVQKKKSRKNLKYTYFKRSLQDQWIDLILILSGLKQISVLYSLSLTRGCFKEKLKVNLDHNIMHLLFLLKMLDKQMK